MTKKRFHWDWKTGRMKDTYSSFQATKDMRLIEQSINDACRSYEKQIAKLEKENEQLNEKNQKLNEEVAILQMDLCKTKSYEQLEKENERLKKDIEYYKTERLALFEYLDKKDDLKLELKVTK